MGTGGHIDHGKSSLVKAFTGTDPDRFAEEKIRGITIDLGFAHYQWKNSLQVSFVDVPGHEKFIHNMLAGVSAIDILLLVIAADDGVMPQTREHLAICQLLKLKHGFIAVSKIDLVDDEMIEIVHEDIHDLTKGTFLEKAPIINISVTKKIGLEEAQFQIAKISDNLPQRKIQDHFRLPVDRSFSTKGYGTIVTGTVISGVVEEKQQFQLYPTEQMVRIRGLQIHGKRNSKAENGQRVALNLVSISSKEIRRGFVIGTEKALCVTRNIETKLKLLHPNSKEIKNRIRIKFYLGTQEIKGQVFIHKQKDAFDKENVYAQIRFTENISCCYGDQFILRSLSPVDTISGGKIIAPKGNLTRKNKFRLIEALQNLDDSEATVRLDETIFLSGIQGIIKEEAFALVGIKEKQLLKEFSKLSSQGKVILIQPEKNKYLHLFHIERIGKFIKKEMVRFHDKFPHKQGANKTEFTGKLSKMFDIKETFNILQWCVKKDFLEVTEERFHLRGHSGHLNAQDIETKNKIINTLLQTDLQTPGLNNLSKLIHVDPKKIIAVLNAGVEEQWSVRIKDDIWYHQSTIQKIQSLLIKYFSEHKKVQVIDFKNITGITRKHSVSLLEYFDRIHITKRIGDFRVLKQSNLI